ncbi:MAG: hypothetical protein J2P52_02495 [Blastocatellia bacterium]|nr:hypothetical protein [Blastocatellia bacterium]
MANIPINIFPGAYKKPGGGEVTGLCVMLENQDGQWEVTTSDNNTTIIKIQNGAKWYAQEYTDPNTGDRMLLILREGAKMNGMAQDLTQPTEGAYTTNASTAKGGGPGLKIYYTTPEDGNTPPIKVLSK